MNKIKKNAKGITLIALVVTIIVLLILAGVAISLSIGNNGLFSRAKNAVNIWEEARKSEENKLDEMFSSIKVASDSKVTLTMQELDQYIEEKIKSISDDEQILSDISSFSLDDKITIYNNRVTVTEGGYKIIGDYVYVYIRAEVQKEMNSVSAWWIFENFPEPEEITPLQVAAETPKNYAFPVASAGIMTNRVIGMGNTSSISVGTKIVIKGKYKLAKNIENE